IKAHDDATRCEDARGGGGGEEEEEGGGRRRKEEENVGKNHICLNQPAGPTGKAKEAGPSGEAEEADLSVEAVEVGPHREAEEAGLSMEAEEAGPSMEVEEAGLSVEAEKAGPSVEAKEAGPEHGRQGGGPRAWRPRRRAGPHQGDRGGLSMPHWEYHSLLPIANKHLQQQWDQASYDIHRRKEMLRVAKENQRFLESLGHCRSIYSAEAWHQEWQKTLTLMENITKYPPRYKGQGADKSNKRCPEEKRNMDAAGKSLPQQPN
ncbi:hypothetical protein CRUP_006399, partial [Coryphaenoides rupestris]